MFDPDLEKDLAEADRAVEYAQQVRQRHRRRTDRRSPQRAQDIGTALQVLKEAMRPIRSRIGRFPSQTQSAGRLDERGPVYEASLAIQRERRKLFKMQDPDNRRIPKS